MSTSNPQDAHDPNSLLYYAPRRVRDRAATLRAIQPRPKESGQSGAPAALEQHPEDDAALAESLFPEALQPASEPQPIEPLAVMRQRARRNEAFAVAARFAAIAGIVAGLALLYVMSFAGSRDRALSTEAGATSLSAMPQSKKLATDQPFQKITAPTLSVEDAEGNINRPLPLGVKVTGHMPGATVNLSGLPADTKLTTGAAAAARQIDPKEIAALIKRGEALASNGDMSAARLLLQRAAEAHNARAAFELAATYDPIVIEQLGNNSARPDLALARAWYQRAREWGSPDAPKQLEALASADR